jgi:hypothetical protein
MNKVYVCLYKPSDAPCAIYGIYKKYGDAIKRIILELVEIYQIKDEELKKVRTNYTDNKEFIEYLYSQYDWNENNSIHNQQRFKCINRYDEFYEKNYVNNMEDLCKKFNCYFDDIEVKIQCHNID